MKKLWKILGITALAAALVPYRAERDGETGDLTLDALLWQGKRTVRDGEKHFNVSFAPWFSPDRTDDLDSLELDGETDGKVDVLDEDFDDLDDIASYAAAPRSDEYPPAEEPAVEITLSVENDEGGPAQA